MYKFILIRFLLMKMNSNVFLDFIKKRNGNDFSNMVKSYNSMDKTIIYLEWKKTIQDK